MKTLLLVLLAPLCQAVNVRVSWDAPQPEHKVLVTDVFYRKADDAREAQVRVSQPENSVIIEDFEEGAVYVFSVRYASELDVSERSVEVYARMPVFIPPPNPQVEIADVVEIQVSRDNMNWDTIALMPLRTADPRRFIRARIGTMPGKP